MNIFVLDEDPFKAAQMACDQHVLKMATETAQILNTNSLFLGGESFVRDYYPYGPYLKTHVNHPCTVWARETRGNFEWLVQHGYGLCLEYTRRFNKVRNVQRAIEWVWENGAAPESGELTPFALCMPDEFKTDDFVESYRRLYIEKKSDFARWLHSDPPTWYTEGLKKTCLCGVMASTPLL